MTDFLTTHRIGVASFWGRRVSAFITVTFKDGKLSITGVVAPTAAGNAACCGQIYESLEGAKNWKFADGWTRAKLAEVIAIWKAWHLNDMQAGSPRQTAYLDANPITDRLNHFTAALAALTEAGLQPDAEYLHNGEPYSYGKAWLKVEVPAEVIATLRALPETDRLAPGAWAKG